MATNIGEKLKFIRKKLNLTQEEFAEKLNLTKPTIMSYEKGKSSITVELLEEICNLVNINLSSFFSENNDVFEGAHIQNDSKKIPIISRVSAGKGEWSREEILEWIELPRSICKDCDFATFVRGDSMEPKIKNGDLILVKQNSTLNSGDIGVFKLGEKVYCKKFYITPITEEIMLKSLNAKYEPIFIDSENPIEFIPLGKVMCSIDYNF
ncbi:HTH cro/C1-type domain-containing protein [Fusobacterium necrophorum subsp. funduliforme]|uniref:S24 family peptidase n=1 Tax=Fusobacterium necrophorum TaxID=859 RepID=UPI00370E83A8